MSAPPPVTPDEDDDPLDRAAEVVRLLSAAFAAALFVIALSAPWWGLASPWGWLRSAVALLPVLLLLGRVLFIVRLLRALASWRPFRRHREEP